MQDCPGDPAFLFTLYHTKFFAGLQFKSCKMIGPAAPGRGGRNSRVKFVLNFFDTKGEDVTDLLQILELELTDQHLIFNTLFVIIVLESEG